MIALLPILRNEIQLIRAKHLYQPFNFFSPVFFFPHRTLSRYPNGAQNQTQSSKSKKPYKLIQHSTNPRDDMISFDGIKGREIEIQEERVDFWGWLGDSSHWWSGTVRRKWNDGGTGWWSVGVLKAKRERRRPERTGTWFWEMFGTNKRIRRPADEGLDGKG